MSYDDTLSDDLSRARFVLGDTSNNATTELLTDDQIESVLALYPPITAGVAMLAEHLAVTYAQKPGRVTLPSGLSVSWDERVGAWRALAQRLRDTGSLTGASIAFSVASSRADGYAAGNTLDEFGRPAWWV